MVDKRLKICYNYSEKAEINDKKTEVNRMKVLSLFDGMACGMLAMQKARLKVDEYIAYKIDKYAIQTATHNFPMIKECGDVFKADFTQYKDIDYIVGGSPCTYWSIAQKTNRETEASGVGWELFSQYVRAINEVKPKYFIYENNKSMSQAIRESISSTFGFEPICINSALVSAQNRQRLYWVGKRNADGTYSKVDVQQPEDKEIILKDILESGEDLTSNEKAYTLTATYNGAVAWNTIERSQRNMVAEPLRIGTIENGLKNQSHDSKQYRVYSPEGKATTLCGNGGGVGAKTGLYAVPCVDDGKKYAVYEVKNSLITIKGKEYPIKLSDGYYIIRKLTITECKRLQTVPEWYEFPVSNAQAYKILGNGWTVDIIAHILKGCV